VRWHDGRPFTADDVLFNAAYASDPATAAVTVAVYRDIKVSKIDSHTVRLENPGPRPFWADAFVGVNGMLIPKHLFEAYSGAKSRDAPTNLKPVGTGPYKFADFKPGDMVRGIINTDYHEPNRPFFDTIEFKGGGDAVSAARATLQTGEFDFAWNLQVEDEILKRLESAGRGRVEITPTGNIEFIQLNACDPWVEVDGERASLKTQHPLFRDPAVREALNLLVDRKSVEDFIYGRTGVATANFVNNPQQFRSPNTSFEFNIAKANEILDKAGWTRGAGGIRAKDGKQLKIVFQTSINAPRQKTQQIIKQACQRAGIDVELKSVTASVFFSSDVANPDTYTKFYADLQEYSNGMNAPDPEVFLRQFCSWEAATKDNKWQGRNVTRWQNKEYDATHKAAQVELDPVKRAALVIRCNELVIENYVVIPLVMRPSAVAAASDLVLEISGWDNNTWDLANWYREG